MTAGFIITLFILLAALIVSDIMNRTVSVYILGCFMVVVILFAFLKHGTGRCVINMCSNLTVILYLFLGLFLYFRIRYGKGIGMIKRSIGAGDIIFIFSLTFLFSPRIFILYLLTASVLSLAYYVAVNIFPGKRIRNVPFVSTAGLTFMAFIIYTEFLS